MLSLALVTGCSTIKGWFSDDEFDPEPVELQKITEQAKPAAGREVLATDRVRVFTKSIRCW